MTTSLASFRLRWLAASTLLAAGLVACGGGSSSSPAPAPAPVPTPAPETIAVTLVGDQEAPTPVRDTAATASATLTLDRSAMTIAATLAVDGLVPTLAHIHAGAAGVAGPVAFPMTISGSTATLATTSITAEQLAALDAGGFYFNVHSAAHATGEIRGQIGREVFNAHLTGSQETAATGSQATGDALLVLDPKTSEVSGSMSLQGISATLAHVHEAPFGTNGSVLIPMQDAGDHAHFAIPEHTVLAAPDVAQLRAGGLYFNAHSAAFAGGEIRGQIGRRILLADADGTQETPPNASAATGHGFVTYDPLTRKIAGSFHVDGTTATVAHVHQAAAGVAGPVVVELMQSQAGTDNSDWMLMDSTPALSFEQATALVSAGMYYNAHSAGFPSGEVRGQLLAAGPATPASAVAH